MLGEKIGKGVGAEIEVVRVGPDPAGTIGQVDGGGAGGQAPLGRRAQGEG